MSSPELTAAYAEGRISRRTFVRRLIAGGVSFGAAVAYAHLLNPERAAARALGDEYSFIGVNAQILPQDLDTVIEEERIRVRYEISHRARVEFQIYLRRPERKTGYYALIGERKLGPVDRGKREAWVPLAVNPPSSVDALRPNGQPLDPAKLDLQAVARRGRQPAWGYDFSKRRLRP